MKRLRSTVPLGTPPAWAALQRRVFAELREVYRPVMERYVREDGSLLWPADPNHSGIDALDDAYESFQNWPVLYLLGGNRDYLDLSLREYDAITQQFSRYDSGHGHPMAVKEYEQGYDWFHQGEGYLFFYHLNLAAPDDARNRERSIRYAGFFMNEDPEAPNYDERLKLIRCAYSGSMGPAYRNFTGEPWMYEDWKAFYGLPFGDVPGIAEIEDIRRPEHAAAMGAVMRERMSRGDVIANLAATTMVANAYLHTGEEKYRAWVVEYVDAWIARAELNGGIVPDNVGLSGQIGETFGGKWYGGYYGWTWPHGWLSIGDAVLIAAENATLLTGDATYMNFARTQIEQLTKQGIFDKGMLRVPYKYGDPGLRHRYQLWIPGVLQTEDGEIVSRDGWFEFQPMDPRYPVHLWHMSQEPGDLALARLLRNHDNRDWERIVKKPAKDLGGHDAAWASYLEGLFPDYPEQILRHNLAQIEERLAFIRDDREDPADYTDSYLQKRNPVTVEGLLQLTMGAPLPMYNGGLVMASVAYWDMQAGRPGLPDDVAALVERIEPGRLVLALVNLNAEASRELRVKGGAFGEHRFVSARELGDSDAADDADAVGASAKTAIDDARFIIELQPSTRIRLELEVARFDNKPAYGDAV
ncbi:hypothetical protein GXP70_21665 [Paenibacillus lycopersici]|uniref:Uncharacterized protein n=1 Tax=Paenibacillus lycopersici TaxID=2704462 RepID=A0A6C0FYX4_9BACL|nr:hypothetical protein [Paenibacillus lycopersici]QHT62328.1 hypothetical protein GXP70_21665 [Paenibacillus lycopersici]